MKIAVDPPWLLWVLLLGAGVSDAFPVAADRPSNQEDLIDRLTELNGRRYIKPYELLRSSSGEYPSERVIFRDVKTGTVLWKMSHNPGYNYHTYSNLLTWNLDGSELLLTSTRLGDKARNWVVTPDGGRWRPFESEAAGWVFWSPIAKDRLIYETRRHLILETDLSTGQTRRLWDLSGEKGEIKLFRPSEDGKKFLVRQAHLPVGDTTHAFALILNADGSGTVQRVDLGFEVGQMWFLKRDDHSFTYNKDNRTSGPYQWMCEPENNGAIRLLSPYSFYHPSVNPLGTRVLAGEAGSRHGLWITEIETGATRLRRPTSRAEASTGGEHFSWECEDGWFVGSIGNAIYEVDADSDRERLLCVPNTQHSERAEAEPESSPDGTKFAYNSTMLGDCDVYVGVQKLPDPPRNLQRQGRILTWDPPVHAKELAGYGVYRGSQLLNRDPIAGRRYEIPSDEGSYTVVAIERSGLQSVCPVREAPPAPTGLAASPRSPFVVELTWRPSPSTGLSYYNVYCSTQSDPAPLQENKVASPTFPQVLDWGLKPGSAYHYVVTAVDRAGNESAPSSPFSVRTPAIDRVFQHVALGQSVGEAPLEVSLEVPRNGHYLLWIELTGENVALKQILSVSLDGLPGVSEIPMWDYVATAHDRSSAKPFFDTLKSDGQCDPWYALKAGEHRLRFALAKGEAKILSLTLTNDAGYLPEGVTRFRNTP